MRAADVMTTPVVTVPPDLPVKEAARVLAENAIAATPVVQHGRLVGMVSELDLLWGNLPPDPRAHILRVDTAAQPADANTVADVMTQEVLALPVDADAADLLAHMRATNCRSIPIVEGDRLVGIVSRRDLLRAFTRSDEQLTAELLTRLREALPGGAWQAEVREGLAVLRPPATDACDDQLALDVAATVPGLLHARIAHD
jgi:CBS domain-containing protein